MKKLICLLFAGISVLAAQSIPNLPVPIGAGSAEVWNDSVYVFGGADRWNGHNRYQSIYWFNGADWSYLDSIPDNNVWGATSVISGNVIWDISD